MRTTVDTISRDELKAILDHGTKVKLVLALPQAPHRSTRIPGTLRFPTVEDALRVLRPEVDIVVYCTGEPCAASLYVARLLRQKGYARVRRYAGGLADWVAAGFATEERGRPTRPVPSG